MIVEHLAERFDVHLVASRPGTSAAGPARGRRHVRSLAKQCVDCVLLDKYEPWSWRELRRLDVTGFCGAVLIGYPWSPIALAARRLRRAKIPHVVDVGDPWRIGLGKGAARLSALRARRLEAQLWRGAAAAILTTEGQKSTIESRYQDLPI